MKGLDCHKASAQEDSDKPIVESDNDMSSDDSE